MAGSSTILMDQQKRKDMTKQSWLRVKAPASSSLPPLQPHPFTQGQTSISTRTATGGRQSKGQGYSELALGAKQREKLGKGSF